MEKKVRTVQISPHAVCIAKAIDDPDYWHYIYMTHSDIFGSEATLIMRKCSRCGTMHGFYIEETDWELMPAGRK